ncbi:MAG TPA: NAD-binding protein [Kofleriaceae bacterium]|jgi:Trk K+ transport system NAD-binding subunit|nr:NAD-binding protein [Kofleriaceae bacterium]
MRRSTRRLAFLLGGVPVLLVGYAVLYMLGMEYLEGTPRGFGRSIEFVAETLTTTGYGSDAIWHSTLMQIFVVIVQFSGLALVIGVFPVFVVPFIEERFEQRLPNALPPLDGAILVYGWGPAVAPLVEHLAQKEVPVVILEEDLATARRLHERGHVVVHARLEEEELDFARVAGARGIVCNASDPASAVLTLAVRQQGYTGRIAALIETPARRGAMTRAGASAVFTPSHVLAAAVAARASDKISPRVSGAQSLGRHLQIVEVRLDKTSALAGKTLADSKLRGETGATIIGWWKDGELRPPPGGADRLEVGAILVAAGTEAAVARLGKLATPVARSGPIIVIGRDPVAVKVAEFLRDAGEDVRTLAGDQDALDPAVLERAGVAGARAVVIALESDGETLFASSLARDLSAEATIVAAARRAENVARIRRAGADFALSVGQVAGQLLAFQLLGEETVAIEAAIKLVRTGAGELAGTHPAGARVRERTGCSVVAVERGDEVIAEFAADFALRADDALYITGADDAIDSFFATFPGARR